MSDISPRSARQAQRASSGEPSSSASGNRLSHLPSRLDTSSPLSRPLSPGAQTPQSAIISIPQDWSYGASPGTSNAASRASFDSDGQSFPMSASSSSSSSSFLYPPNLPTSSRMNQTSFDHSRERSDPYENPFQNRSISGESDEDSSRQSLDIDATPLPAVGVPNDQRRGSVTMIPHHVQLRTLTDPVIQDGVTIDAEFSVLPMTAASTDGFPFDQDALAVPAPPTFNRTFSAPLPSRMGALRHPLSASVDPLRSYSAHPPRQGSASSSSAQTPDTPTMRPPALSSLRADTSSSGATTLVSRASSSSAPDQGDSAIRALSVELADSVQSAIQTLLHLSPPHLLDNAKEQYSGCSVQMPSTSLSALLTAMKSLNYFSANAQSLMEGMKPTAKDVSAETRERRPSGLFGSAAVKGADFDIGELAQNVADLLSGQAAQLGVDLVLFHGDVGIKHVAVNGDPEGLGYLLSHILRQLLAVSSPGDTIEIGLQVVPQSPSMTPRVSLPLSASDIPSRPRATETGEPSRPSSPGRTLPTPPSGSEEGPLLCVFEIVHNISQASDQSAETPRAETNPFVHLSEMRESTTPRLDTVLCQRLLLHQNANLRVDTQPTSPIGSGLPRKAYELTVLLPRGEPMVEPISLSLEEEAIRQPFATMKLAREPTLGELSTFAESLRGKKVVLHASLSSVFARHLTSYLGAWGMDISHVPVEETDEKQAYGQPQQPRQLDEQAAALNPSASTPDLPASLAAMSLESPVGKEKFIIIDDDVAVLKRELMRMRAEVYAQYKPRLTKRPTLSARTRSSPLVRLATNTVKPANSVLIHFTSIGKYNQVRDIVASLLGAPHAGLAAGTFLHPEVMVVPKPVGPRRFLTALHTAVYQPVVDPFFSPIATSPRSPGGEYFNGRSTPTGSESNTARDGFFDTVAEENESDLHPPHPAGSETKARSPLGEYPPAVSAASGPASVVQTSDGLRIALPTPGVNEHGIVATPAAEYFSNALGRSSPAGGSAVVMQSPDGRPFGMFFEPPVKAERRQTGILPSNKRRMTASARRTSLGIDGSDRPGSAGHSDHARGDTRSHGSSRRSSGAAELAPQGSEGKETGTRPDPASRRKTLPSQPAEPVFAAGRDRSATITKKAGPAAIEKTTSNAPSSVPAETATSPDEIKASKPRGREKGTKVPGKDKKKDDDVVVPPINVLIVEDNPINQNILSMFLRKKKIKHGTAKDGLEAVEKWRTGGYHLILMDIQLPVMDGIEATKEIRKLERSNNIGVFPATPISEHPAAPAMSAVARLASGAASPMGEGKPSTPFRSSVIIVALTASSLQSDRVVALAAGCNDFLTKPVSLKWLERKIVEWGCMQALIDFDGWRRAKSSDPKEETRRGFQTGPQAAAKSLANRLKINPDRKASRQASVSSVGSTRSDGGGSSNNVPRVQILPDTPASQTASPVAASDLLPAVEAAAVELSENETARKNSRQQEAEDDAQTPTPKMTTAAPASSAEGAEIEVDSMAVQSSGIKSGPPDDRDFAAEQKDRAGTDIGPGGEMEAGADEAVSAADEAVSAAAEAVERAPPVPDKEGQEEKPLPAVPMP